VSRYVHVAAPCLTVMSEVAEGLAALELPVQRERKPVMLEGSVECAGEPVELRLPAGTLDAVEDFGFVRTDEVGDLTAAADCDSPYQVAS
jgi:hypothetical protein